MMLEALGRYARVIATGLQPAGPVLTSYQCGPAVAGLETDQETLVSAHLTPTIRPAIRAGLLVAALILAATTVSACRLLAAPGGGSGQQQVTIKAQDTMRFDPASVTVPVGQSVQVTLANDGTLVHDFVLTDGVTQPVKIEANPKANASATFTVARPGTYTYVCAQPGHEAAGMKGTLVAR